MFWFFFVGAYKRTLEIPEPSHSACCWKFLTADGATERELLFYVTQNPHFICKKKSNKKTKRNKVKNVIQVTSSQTRSVHSKGVSRCGKTIVKKVLCEVKAIFGGARLACYFCQQESEGEGAGLRGGRTYFSVTCLR